MDTIAIWGIGPIGILLAKWATFMGANVILIARNSIKKDAAEKFGFIHVINSQVINPVEYINNLTKGHGADICVEGTGRGDALTYCLEACCKMGRIICLGNPVGSINLSQQSYWAILRKQLHLIGTWNSSFTELHNEWKDTLTAMALKKID